MYDKYAISGTAEYRTYRTYRTFFGSSADGSKEISKFFTESPLFCMLSKSLFTPSPIRLFYGIEIHPSLKISK